MRYYFRLSAAVFLSFLILEASPVKIWAAGTASRCLVTVKGIKLKDMDNAWFNVPIKEVKLDLGKPDQTISFKNDGRIPAGRYKNFKIILSETLQVSGHDGDNYTTEGGQLEVGGVARRMSELPGDITSMTESTKTWNKNSEGLMTVKINLDFEDRDDVMEIYGSRDLEEPFKVKAKSNLVFVISVNLEDTINFAWPDSLARGIPSHNVMYFLPPTSVTEVSISSDKYTTSFDSDYIDISF